MEEKRLLHSNLCESDVSTRYAIVPGSPQRVEKIAKYMDDPEKIRVFREYETWSGKLEGQKIIIMSTGIGGPSTAIAVEELYELGIDTFIRVGTCASTSALCNRGDVVIPQASVRMEGTALHYAPLEYPAVPTIEVFDELRNACATLDLPYRVGTVICRDLFYTQYDDVEEPASYYTKSAWNAYKKLGAIATEMETATLFIAGNKLNARTGACMVCATDYVKDVNKTYPTDYEARAIKVGIEALKNIIRNDTNK